MKITQNFTVPHPPEAVWEFMSDVGLVATCIPGLELTDEREGGAYLGTFAVKVGPVVAKLDGEGVLSRDDATRSATLEGKGGDKRGGSRASGTMRYAVVGDGEGAAVEVEADIKLSGPLAQIGRTGIIEDVARTLTEQFAANIASRLAATQDEPEIGQFDAGSAVSRALWRRLVGFLKRLFGFGGGGGGAESGSSGSR